ncbi:MAG TPA: hypothetical protein VHU86_03585 [Solirubrobacterales bacterium]|jgi:hypothetical protein|nr:hypothetical protein [Solirubrobacterales bacterium]
MRRAIRLFALTAAALACIAVAASAESTQHGDLIISFDGGIAPKRLPRTTVAPVSVRVAGGVKTTAGLRLPQLRTIAVSINRAGRLDDQGLPTCKVGSIQPATEAVAKKRCADSIVGSGHVTLVVRLPSQDDYISRNNLLAFNGPRVHGKKLILAQIYSKNPPGAIILTFTVKKHQGIYGNVIETTLPSYAENWAYLTQFEMTLGRTWTSHGKEHSYVSASCAAPAGFTKALFPFAKASYKFGTGEVLTTKVVRSCQVSGK